MAIAVLACLICLAGARWQTADAQALRSVSLEWDAGAEANLAGYVVVVAIDGETEQLMNVGRATAFTFAFRAGRSGRAWVQAYNTAGLVSPPSNVVEFSAIGGAIGGEALPLQWQYQHGVIDPIDDPDRDGLTNIEEWRRQTDPWLPNRWYFAEGAVGFFQTQLLFVNPGLGDASGTVTFRSAVGDRLVNFSVRPRSRSTLDVESVFGKGVATPFSLVVDVELGGVVVERTMRWSPRLGSAPVAGHTRQGIAAPSTTWYFADGDTRGRDSFLVLVNESALVARAVVEHVGAAGVIVSVPHDLAPYSRQVIHENLVPGFAAGPFWTRISSDVPILAERTVYLIADHAWVGGETVPASPAPSRLWHFADGLTGAMFDTRLVLTNPQTQPASVEVTWLQPAKPPLTTIREVGPEGRVSLLANAEAGLESTAVSAVVRSSIPIVAERQVAWPAYQSAPIEIHVNAGAPVAGQRWLMAEGEVGGPTNVETFLIVLNPGDTSADVSIVLLREGGPPREHAMQVAGLSRGALRLRDLGLSPGERFGLEVRSSAPIVVERSMYWSGEGWYIRGGTNTTAFRVW